MDGEKSFQIRGSAGGRRGVRRLRTARSGESDTIPHAGIVHDSCHKHELVNTHRDRPPVLAHAGKGPGAEA